MRTLRSSRDIPPPPHSAPLIYKGAEYQGWCSPEKDITVCLLKSLLKESIVENEASKWTTGNKILDAAICAAKDKTLSGVPFPHRCPCYSCRHYPEWEISRDGKRGKRFCKQANRALETFRQKSLYRVTLISCDYFEAVRAEGATCSDVVSTPPLVRKYPLIIKTSSQPGNRPKTRRKTNV